MTFVNYDVCHITTIVAYDFCRTMKFVGYDVCRLIMFVRYDIYRLIALLFLSLMKFVAYEVWSHVAYDVCSCAKNYNNKLGPALSPTLVTKAGDICKFPVKFKFICKIFICIYESQMFMLFRKIPNKVITQTV